MTTLWTDFDYRYGWRWLLPLRDHEDYGESTMHNETELDDVYAERLVELQKHLNKPLPQLVAEMLAKAIDETPEPAETEGQKVLRNFESTTNERFHEGR